MRGIQSSIAAQMVEIGCGHGPSSLRKGKPGKKPAQQLGLLRLSGDPRVVNHINLNHYRPPEITY